MSEDEIASLDFDWQIFTPGEQAAFAFCRKLTVEPHLLNDDDIRQLQEHFTDLQILEIVLTIAGNNSTNRWKEGAGIPQSSSGGGLGRRQEGADESTHREPHTYVTPTSEKFQSTITRVAPLVFDEFGQPTRQSHRMRPPLESRADVEAMLAACRNRTPRLPLVSEADARALLPDEWKTDSVPQWVRLLANFPQDGKRRIQSIHNAERNMDALSPLLMAQVSWITAREDRAWYATGQAYARLKQLGCSDDQIFALDGNWDGFSESDRAMFTVARYLATAPIVLTDAQAAEAVEHCGPRAVVQLVSYVTNRAAFNRITEAAGLAIE